MTHHCHWPGCKREVPPRLWGCREHWFRLPKTLRDWIWATYIPGQEITKDPSVEYVMAAAAVRAWILSEQHNICPICLVVYDKFDIHECRDPQDVIIRGES